MKEKYIETAHQIGSRFLREAYWKDDYCVWSGYVNSVNANKIAYGFMDSDLYSGTSGISFFLAQLYKVSQDNLFKKAAISGLNFSIKNLNKYDFVGRESLFAGLGGIAYAFYTAGIATGDEELLDKAVFIIENIVDNQQFELGKDIINGPPGFLVFLLKIRNKITIKNSEVYIEKLINHIIKNASISEEGVSWNTIDGSYKNLTGYAHGASGFALALAEAYHVFKNEEYKNLAIKSCQYENVYFNTSKNNWPDFRDNRKDAFMTAWCHGSPGIGASRARMYKILKEDFLLQDTKNAVKSLVENDQYILDNNHPHFSYCHGIFGNADLLIYMNKFSQSPEANNHILKIADYGYEKFTKYNLEFPSGILSGKYNPSLMLGEAGIGLFYLRMIDNDIPTPLLIQ